MTYYDETAEKALLGVALMAPKATAPLRLTEADFHHPVHGSTWEAIHAAHGEGLTPDATTVLARVPEAMRRFAAELLVEVVGLGAVGNAEAYADTIRDRAERRRIASVLDGARQRLDQPDEAAHDTLAYIERHVTQGGSLDQAAEKLWTLDEFLDRNLPPVSWVIPDLLAEGERLVLTGTEGMGKALALDTRLPTPTGWTTMGEVKPGDYVLGSDGTPTRVVAATEVQHGRPCYRVTFSDGSALVADERHEWLTETLLAREAHAKYSTRPTETAPRGTDQRHKRKHFPAVIETGQIRDTLHARPGFINHSVETCEPLDLPESNLPVDPYVLGAWLGDGTSRTAEITTHHDDSAILDRIRLAGYTVENLRGYQWSITRREQRAAAKIEAERLVAAGASRRAALRDTGLDRRRGMTVEPVVSLRSELRALGVLGNKHIPTEYLRASFSQRLALAQGLMDTDGTIGASGACEFTCCNRALAHGVLELLLTLGIKAVISESDATLKGRVVGRRWRIRFRTDVPVFHLPRKAGRVGPVSRRAKLRYIIAVDPVDSVPVRCIQVAALDHLYLAGESFIPTHNSVLMRQIGVMVSAGLDPFTLATIPAKRVLFVDCENPERIMMSRLGELRAVAFNRHARPGMSLRRFPQGLDLANPRDRLELHHLCSLIHPELLLIGPAYKLYIGGSGAREEDLARQVTATLDGLREEFGFALILEHHSPHAAPGSEQRSVRPIGSSLWLRWPEFGMGIRPQRGTRPTDRMGEMRAWRGPRDERPWPAELVSGGPGALPWVSADMTHPQRRAS